MSSYIGIGFISKWTTKDAKDVKPVLANDKTIIIRKELSDGTIKI